MQVTVLGITGGVGDAVATAALDAGHQVVALVRNAARVPARPGLTIVEGDARNPADLDAALKGSDVVLHGLNLPYDKWDPGMKELTANVLEAAERSGTTVLFPGNVYNLGGPYDAPLREDASRDCPSRKGRVRNQLEAQLEASAVRTIVLRMGDFFGGIGEGTWMWHLTNSVPKGGKIGYPAATDIPHAWAYLPDAARTFIRLAERRDELPEHSSWHFAGHIATGEAFIDAVRAGVGAPDRRMSRFPWFWMQFVRPFMPVVNELYEMRYLWDEPVRMDGSKLESFLGDVPHTPFEEAIAAALA